MAELQELRMSLDELDKDLVELLEKRFELSKEIGQVKIEEGKKVYDKIREQEKIDSVKELASCEFTRKSIGEVFDQLLSISRKVHYQMLTEKGALGRLPFIKIASLNAENARIVFQGVKGAYGQAAMNQYFGEECNSFHVKTFREAMEAIEEGSADYAVLPIENSTAGAVNEVFDLLVEFENYIVGETIIPISHTLSGLPGAKLEDITTVYSKAEALMQTSHYLDQHPSWQQISVANTAIAAEKVVKENDITKAAVCSSYAARLNGLQVFDDNINDEKNNSTRFIVITNQKVFLEGASKISICFELLHESGSLYHLLSHFIYNDLNMTKIESRPVDGKSWEYRFFIDFDGNLEEPAVKNAIRGLRSESRNLKILGNY